MSKKSVPILYISETVQNYEKPIAKYEFNHFEELLSPNPLEMIEQCIFRFFIILNYFRNIRGGNRYFYRYDI